MLNSVYTDQEVVLLILWQAGKEERRMGRQESYIHRLTGGQVDRQTVIRNGEAKIVVYDKIDYRGRRHVAKIRTGWIGN